MKPVILRSEPLPDDTVLMMRAGLNGVDPAKLRSDAQRSHQTIGILGLSVQASLPGETLVDAWSRSRILRDRNVVWWATAGALRAAGFPLLATGTEKRHYTIALAHTDDELLSQLCVQFVKEDR